MSINIKSELAPKGLSFNPSDFFISDKYATILTVVSGVQYLWAYRDVIDTNK